MQGVQMLNWFKQITRTKPPRQVLALMYHRIAGQGWDPWQLNVSPLNFRRQVKSLATHFHICSVGELTGTIPGNKPIAVVTFDDGYLDNYTSALPILEEYGVPATFYIPIGRLGTSSGFWWDQLAEVFLKTEALPDKGAVTLGSSMFHFSPGASAKLSAAELEICKSWKYGDPHQNERMNLFLFFWKTLKFTPTIDPYAVTEELMRWAGVTCKDAECINAEQLHVISKKGPFSIGVHTKNHPYLPSLSASEQRIEIEGCQKELGEIIGVLPNSFAAPYGGYNAETLNIIKDLGFATAFTTENHPGTVRNVHAKPLQIPRIHVTHTFDPTMFIQR